MKPIAVIGAGRVGLVSAACFAYLGNTVTCIERNPVYLEILRTGRVPFVEPNLPDLVSEYAGAGTLRFTSSIEDGIAGADIIFLAVGTPQATDGAVDLTDVLAAAEQIGRSLKRNVCIVSKSTIPPGTTDRLRAIIASATNGAYRVTMTSNPEFLREGSAVHDFLRPDRIVIGVERDDDACELRALYASLDAPVIVTDIRTAELIKSVANFYLALRISFANQVADLCEALHIDVLNVLDAVGMDARIGKSYLRPGPGFGGPCLPKDLRGLADSAGRFGVDTPLVDAVLRVNDQRIERAIEALSRDVDGLRARCICVLGLSFKAGTDDIRDSPSLRFIAALQHAGASVRTHDPAALENFRHCAASAGVHCSSRIDDAVRGADAVAVMTAWAQYKELSLSAMRSAMRGDLLFDGTNLFDPASVVAAGLRYRGMGRAGARVADEAPKEIAHVSA